MKKTNVYVDGFNLYYGIKATSYRWLNPLELCRRLLPNSSIQRIRYFTANVKPRGDPGVVGRQQTYLRALQTLPDTTLHFGAFLVSTPRMRLESPVPGAPATVQVIKTEEKGSDVNIASYMLLDAFHGDFETAALIPNDSDLVTPINMVRSEFGCDVIVLNPHPRQSAELKKAATLVRTIRKGVLSGSQFPPQLTDARGQITKPALWDEHAWCVRCHKAGLSRRWLKKVCPNCASSDAVAWSVILLRHPGYPAAPVPGETYPL